MPFLLSTQNGENSERNIIVKREKSLIYKAFLREVSCKNNLYDILEADGNKRRDWNFKRKYRTIRTHEKWGEKEGFEKEFWREFGEKKGKKRPLERTQERTKRE